MGSSDYCDLDQFDIFCRRIRSTTDRRILEAELKAIGKAIENNVSLKDETHLFDLSGKQAILRKRLLEFE